MFLCKGREGKDKAKEGGREEWQLRDVSRVNGDVDPPDIMDHAGWPGRSSTWLAFESGQGRGRSFNNIKPYDIKTITGRGYTNFL